MPRMPHGNPRPARHKLAAFNPSLGTNPSAQECAKCHSDHNGLNFNMVRSDPPNREALDPQRRLSLEETCWSSLRECHKADNRPRAGVWASRSRSETARIWAIAQLRKLPHGEHRGQFGRTVRASISWRAEAGSTIFNHAASKSPLTGAHEKCYCVKCHAVIQDANAKQYGPYNGNSLR